MAKNKRSLLILALLLYPVGLHAATLDTLITQLRIKLGQTDSTNSTWTNTELRNCINQVQYGIAPYGAFSKLDTLAGGSSRYAPNSDFSHLKGSAWLWRNGQEITPIPYVPVDSFYRVIGRNTKTSMGKDVYVIAEDAMKIAIFPETNAIDSIIVAYYAFPDFLTGVEECSFNLEWEQVLLSAACACAWEKAGTLDRAQMYIAERDKLIQALTGLETRKPQPTKVP